MPVVIPAVILKPLWQAYSLRMVLLLIAVAQFGLLVKLPMGYSRFSQSSSPFLSLLSYWPEVLYVFSLLLFLGLLLAPKLFIDTRYAPVVFKHRASALAALINLTCFGLLAILFWHAPAKESPLDQLVSWQEALFLLSPLLWSGMILGAFACLLPLRTLGSFVKDYSFFFFVLLVISISIRYSVFTTLYVDAMTGIWTDYLGIPTLNTVVGMAQLFGQTIVVQGHGAEGPIFGTSLFQVEMWAFCSGYEGLLLITFILALYLLLQRKALRFPNALWILPAAGVAMFFLNALRIFVLIMIGTYSNPEVALGGFHSAAGLISVVLVSIVSVLALDQLPYYSKFAGNVLPIEAVKPDNRVAEQDNVRSQEQTRLNLLPLILLIGSGLITQLASTKFAWLYPIPILLTAGFLYRHRAQYTFWKTNTNLSAIVAGIVVFGLWVWIIPPDIQVSNEFSQTLFSGSFGISVGWLLFRIIGAVLIVPIVEELAFRAFLQRYLTQYFERAKNLNFQRYASAASITLSSLAFGLLHSEVIAATIAGVIYGLVMLQRGKIIDAIVAHAITNFLLSLYVLFFGYWSYW